uniref:Putative ovule protein n=1 Tax=Solanum chacoense TaxID=4108 RepID=A0A0V0IG02_SOLCH
MNGSMGCLSRPKLEGRNWLLMPKLRPEPTLLNHLLLAHAATRNQEIKQVYLGLKLSHRPARPLLIDL